MKIDKAYFTLAEVCERWRMPEADLAYMAENDELRVSVRVFGVPIEIYSWEEDRDGRPFRIPLEQSWYSGLLDLHVGDAFRIFRDGHAQLSHFRAPDGDDASLLRDDREVEVRTRDLLVRKEERDRVELKMGFAQKQPECAAALEASPDYREVRLGGETWRLGPLQAEVIRVLHAAHLAGDPWQSGKAILTAAGSKSLKMVDVFKSQPGWRRLVLSNRRGDYRLAPDEDPT